MPAINSDLAYIPAVNFTSVAVDPAPPILGHVLFYFKDGSFLFQDSTGTVSTVGGAPALTENLLAVGDSGGALAALAAGSEGAIPTRQADGTIAEVVPPPEPLAANLLAVGDLGNALIGLAAGAEGAVPTRQADGTIAEVVPSGGGGGGGIGHATILPMSFSAYSGQRPYPQNLGASPYSYYIRRDAGLINNTIDYSLGLAPGTYTLQLWYATHTTAGIITPTIDGQSLAPLDCYSGTLIQNVIHEWTGIVVTVGGAKTLRFAVLAKNASASDYHQYLSMIVIWQTA